MPKNQTLKVVKSFDSSIDYGVNIPKAYKKVYSDLEHGHIFSGKEFVLNKMPNYTKSKNANSISAYGWRILRTGKQIGILQDCNKNKPPITRHDFNELETVSYWLSQLRVTKFKNLKTRKSQKSGTVDQYSYRTWIFNNWLHDKQFVLHQTRQIDKDTFKRIENTVTIQGLEHLLKLYQDPHSIESDFIKIVKRFLLDSMHKNKKASTIMIDYSAIKSYFDKNETPLNFKFNPKTNYDSGREDEVYTVSLEDFMKILTVGQPTLTEKSVFLCKFHRGLDASTFADRFNFQAFEQLTDYFGTEQYMRWDLTKCPIPIKLTRIKTDFLHTGFLDIDAVKSIQDYLEYRYSKTGKVIQEGEPMFLNKFQRPISPQWIQDKFFKLAKRSGLLKVVNSFGNQYSFGSHEVRDLLKSTLIDCGTRLDIADHVIGHMPKDSYEKQTILYPESMREQYMKASRRINIFSNMRNNMQSSVDSQELKTEVETLKEIVNRLQQKEEIRNQIQNKLI